MPRARQYVGGKAHLARHAGRVPKAAVVGRENVDTQTRCERLVVLDALTQHACGAVAMEEEHGRVRAERSAYVRVDVDWSGRGGIRGGGGGGDEE